MTQTQGIERIDSQTAHRDLDAGTALIVCAYPSREKFEQNHLEGAIALDDFESRAKKLPKDREIIFYCA
jgi:rhodanese-related sulfurtransferase